MFDLRARNTCGAGVTHKGVKHVQTQGRSRLLALIANLWGGVGQGGSSWTNIENKQRR